MNVKRTSRIAAGILAVACACAAQAEPRREAREHARYATPHWVFDARYHHDHYYPAVGYHVDVLPPGNIAVHFRSGNFWFHSGVWYQHVGPRYVVVRPPAGIIVPVLPPAYAVVYYGGVPYYYADDIYYVQQPTGYEVVAPPPDPAQAAAPGAGAPPAPASGTWYYCDSAKSYYPYVALCPEGWKSVPATPPPAPPR
ncbi:MAG TPA: DUF6515 family protein [Burkholderiales bacterium]|nr:DUF6515 family protein [Burkholderiales bacterium]